MNKVVIEPAGHFLVNGEEYNLEHGSLWDWGTNQDITTRTYGIDLSSSDDFTPANIFEFTIKSWDTKRLSEGTYDYTYYAYDPGYFTNLEFAYNLEYDESNEVVAGTRFTEYNSNFSGTITISKEDGNYKFAFDIQVDPDSENIESFNVTGEFCEVLEAY